MKIGDELARLLVTIKQVDLVKSDLAVRAPAVVRDLVFMAGASLD